MSFLKPSSLYRLLVSAYATWKWMPCQSWAFLRCPSFDGFLRFLVIMLLWSMFAEIRFIPSSSMYPTLRPDDRIIVEKVSLYIRSPARQDIVLFRAPIQPPELRDEAIFIKRIVATAGDLVEVNQGMLYVNGVGLQEDYIAEPPRYRLDLTVMCLCWATTVTIASTLTFGELFLLKTLLEDLFFVVSDLQQTSKYWIRQQFRDNWMT